MATPNLDGAGGGDLDVRQALRGFAGIDVALETMGVVSSDGGSGGAGVP